MKFVCESCKAKYQIADDKVAGKTLRMKCRRCGHLIQVNATVTEGSVSKLNPAAPSFAAEPSPPAPAPANRPPPPPRPGGAPLEKKAEEEDGATVVRPTPMLLRSLSSPPPRPPGGPRIVPPARASVASLRRSVPPGDSGGLGTAHAVGRAGMDSGFAPRTSSPGLGGGFARAVQGYSEAHDLSSAPESAPMPVSRMPENSTAPLPTEDWYVGIGGVPLGPVRLSVLREKASAGQVDGESLVWREGFDEWQPLRTVQGLLLLVDEARNLRSSRTSMPIVTPTPAPVQPAWAPTNGSAAPGPGPGLTPTPPPSAAASPSVPEPAASLPFSLVRQSQPPVSNGAAAVVVTQLPTSSSLPSGLDDPGAQSIPPKKRRGLHPMALAFIVMAATFGGVAAWAVFLRKPPEIRYVEVNGQPQVQTTGPNGELVTPPPPPPTGEATTAEPVNTGQSVGHSGVPGTKPTTVKTNEPGTTAPIDTSGFKVPGGPTGPEATAPTGKGKLSQGEIEGVVNRGKAGISRRCWDPAYDARSSNAPKSARVTVSFTVQPSGSVSSVSASGGDAFPGLASCVASSVRSWSFPPSEEASPVTVPFGFNKQ